MTELLKEATRRRLMSLNLDPETYVVQRFSTEEKRRRLRRRGVHLGVEEDDDNNEENEEFSIISSGNMLSMLSGSNCQPVDDSTSQSRSPQQRSRSSPPLREFTSSSGMLQRRPSLSRSSSPPQFPQYNLQSNHQFPSRAQPLQDSLFDSQPPPLPPRATSRAGPLIPPRSGRFNII